MPRNHRNNHKIEITSLMDDAIENAIARREQSLTPEEAEKIKGGEKVAIFGGRLFPPIIITH
ncbi:MAG: hypothetical protein QNJ42_11555 [Crocosphaera sp.]|nr:hypothetical protein [Crocosphaera sp.]